MKEQDNQFSHLSDDDLELTVQKVVAACKVIPLYKENISFRNLVIKLENGLGEFSDAVAREISVNLMNDIKLSILYKKAMIVATDHLP